MSAKQERLTTDLGTEYDIRHTEEGIGTCGWILVGLSYFLCILSFPFSLCLTVKVVQEYERAVIMRLGRILPGKNRRRI